MKKTVISVCLSLGLIAFAAANVATAQPAPSYNPATMPPPNNGVVTPVVQPGILYIVLGGNGTCNRNGFSSVVPGLKDVILFDSFNRWFLNSGVVTPADNVVYTCYEWLSPQMQYFVLRGSRAMAPMHENQLDGLVGSLMQNVRKIIIIGHSHAGWRAMKLASSPYIGALPVPILLASLDPVSRVTCQRLRDDGCREAPRDFTQAEWYQLNTRTRWLNLYHQPAMILGSGPMPAAHYNLQVFANHVAIESDYTVWFNVRQFVMENLR
jgi:hypothetical protein